MRHPKTSLLIRKSGEPNEHADICLRFKKTREEMNLTQSDYAEMLGVGLSKVKSIERGYFAPSLSTIKVWHKRFNKTYNWIMEGKDVL